MELRQTLSSESGQKVPSSITSALVSALLEWMLMFMIFVDSSFAYFVTRFARHYHLRIPCLLCSRLDHVLGNERAGFYWDLICHKHKSKISSLVLCHLHNDHVDVQGTSKYNGDEVQEITEESSQLGQIQKDDGDPLPHVEYSQVKVSSDTESEGLFSDNESGTALVREMEASGQDSVAKYDSTEPHTTTFADCPAAEMLIHLASPIEISLSESGDRIYRDQNVESEAPVGHGLEELNWQQADYNADVSKPSEVVSFPDVHPSPNDNGTHYIESKEAHAANTTELEKEVPVEYGEDSKHRSDSTAKAELSKEVNMECRGTFTVGSDLNTSEVHLDLKPNKTDTSSQMPESLDLGDAYKLAVGARGRQLSGRFLEQKRSMTDSTKASEDLKLLLSHISAVSPKVSGNSEDFKAMDSSVALGMQFFQRRISLERNESNLSLDGSTVSEIEGENEVDRLKRQVEHDKKMLSTVYKDLEEERNASAIAANQAMAMITRLQEEKAAFHMEALQCLRMMEEQAEYDSEALQKVNEFLAEKEKQLQDLEFELELYRNQLGDVPSSSNFVKPRIESEADEIKEQHILEADCARISLSQFEDEKRDLLECLKKMEEKLSIFTKYEANSTDEVIEASASDQDFMGVTQENGRTVKNHLPRDTLTLKETHMELCGDENLQHQNGACGKLCSKDVELNALRRELSVVKNRLGALEVEKDVIECSMNALEKGSQGVEFIREIAVRLQELHSSHIIKRNDVLT